MLILWHNKDIILDINGGLVVGFLFFIILVILMVLLMEKVIFKLFGVEKKRISETSGKNIDRWGRSVILIIFLCALPFVVAKDINVMKWYWILYFILSLGFQSVMEWTYLKNSKQYVTTLIYLMVSVIIVFNIEYFVNR